MEASRVIEKLILMSAETFKDYDSMHTKATG